jgi:hypothetical protein
MASKVFECEDLRREILSYFPNRCFECKNILLNKLYSDNNRYYKDYAWKHTKNKKMPKVCNWCYYYVYEYN